VYEAGHAEGRSHQRANVPSAARCKAHSTEV